MPYKSDAQRKWAHTESAKKAGFPTDEFDKASKGKDLPEKAPKMAEGGSVYTGVPKSEPPKLSPIESFLNKHVNGDTHVGIHPFNGGDGHKPVGIEIAKRFADGGTVSYQPPKPNEPSMDWKDQLKEYMEKNFQPHHEMGSNLEGFQNLMKDKVQASTDVPHMADGGEVDWMQGAAEKMTAPPTMPTVPQFNPKAGLPPSLPPTMPLQQPQRPVLAPNPAPMASPMPANNEVSNYLNSQKEQIGKYGPEQQMAVQQALLKGRTGLGGSLAAAGGGLADAIMQGVARAGPSNFQERIQNQQKGISDEIMQTMEKARTANIQNVEAKQKIDEMNPDSPLSKAKQAAYTPVLQALGYNPQAISRMAGSNIDTVTNIAAQYGGKKLEVLMKQAEIAMKQMELGETTRAHKAEESNVEAKQAEEAATALAAHPILHPINAIRANKALAQTAGIGNAAQPSTGPLGPTTTQNGKTYEWSPQTQKYHLVK
jgi:hypothetical protein